MVKSEKARQKTKL